MGGTPAFGLKKLKEAVRRYIDGEDTLWFSATSRSIDYTVNAIRSRPKPPYSTVFFLLMMGILLRGYFSGTCSAMSMVWKGTLGTIGM